MAGLFIKVDCDYWDHPKVVAAGLMAGVLYLRMTAYCMQHTTDGFVPAGQIPRFALPSTAKLTQALAGVGLIEQVEGGWMVPGYVERYRTAAEVAELRGKRAAAGRKGGRPRKQPESKLLSSGFDNEKANGNPEVEVEVDTKEPSSSDTSAARPRTDDAEDSLTVELLELAGLAQPRPTTGELRTVARLTARGWSADQLRAMATRASLADVDPRAYLAKMLAESMNARPDGTPRQPERRPLLDDERAPCTDCGASGWVDAPDGSGVLRCTTCTGVRA